jgi:hypothetical protein
MEQIQPVIAPVVYLKLVCMLFLHARFMRGKVKTVVTFVATLVFTLIQNSKFR